MSEHLQEYLEHRVSLPPEVAAATLAQLKRYLVQVGYDRFRAEMDKVEPAHG